MSDHYEIVNLERLVKSQEQDLDRLRAENARLASDIEGLMKEFKSCHEAIGLSMASSEPLSCFLQRHRTALEEARVALEMSQSFIGKPMPLKTHPESLVAVIADALRHIDEVLK